MDKKVFADPNFEDGDIEPAPKLIEVVLQNCKGRVDEWVEPYLRISIDRLGRTEKSYLKDLLVEVVFSQAHFLMECAHLSVVVFSSRRACFTLI